MLSVISLPSRTYIFATASPTPFVTSTVPVILSSNVKTAAFRTLRMSLSFLAAIWRVLEERAGEARDVEV